MNQLKPKTSTKMIMANSGLHLLISITWVIMFCLSWVGRC